MLMKVILVEDEDILLEGLAKLVDWRNLGYYICAKENDYEGAIKAAYTYKPDLLITDIMLGEGKKTGLDLVKQLSALLPEMQSVILTGYERFEFAERAIEYNVSSYLLKPVSQFELEGCLQKIHQKYNSRQEELRQRHQMREQLETAQPFLLDWFLNSAGRDQNWKEYFELTGQERQWQVVVLSFPESNKGYYDIYLHLECLKELRYPKIKSFYRHNQIVFISHNTEPNEKFEVVGLPEMLMEYCDFNAIAEAVIGIGSLVRKFDDIKRSYEEAEAVCRHLLFFGDQRIMYYSDLVLSGNNLVNEFSQKKDELLFAIKTGHGKEAECILKTTLEQACDKGMSIQALCSFGVEAMVLLNDLILENQLQEINPIVWDELSNCTSLKNLYQVLKREYANVGNQLNAKRKDRNKYIMEQVHQLIENNYWKNLTLEYAAKLVCLSPPYLSSLFQNTYGISFKDFLIKTRINAACKKLREGNQKVYEVAEQVGYSDSRYFSQVFRKYTGITPLEYREEK